MVGLAASGLVTSSIAALRRSRPRPIDTVRGSTETVGVWTGVCCDETAVRKWTVEIPLPLPIELSDVL